MSQFNSQQIDAPFRQALIRPAAPNRGRAGGGGSMPQMGWIGAGDQGNFDNDAMRLQNAQNLAVARRQQGQGQSASSENYMSGGPSPIQKAIVASKQAMLTQALSGNESDEEKNQLGELANNPNLALNDFQRVLGSRRKPAAAAPQKPQHDFGDQPQTAAAPQDPVNIPKGVFAGQQMQQGDILMNGPKGVSASLGFVTPPQGQQPQGNQDQIVNMVRAFQQKNPNADLTEIKALANSGATGEQIFNAMHGMEKDENNQQAGQQRQQMAQHKAQLSNLVRQQSQLHGEVTKMHSQLSQFGINPDGPEAEARQAGPEALSMYQQYHQKGQQFQALSQQIEGGIQSMGGGQQPQADQQADLKNLPADYQMNGSAQAPQQGHVPHAQFGPNGQVVQGSRGPISPDIAAHYIRRTGSVEAGKAAAAAEGWQL